MASDGTVVLQSVNRMFDRLFAEKRQRSLDALKMVELGLKDRQMTMMEEVRGLQVQQSKMQMAAYVLGDMQKQTNVQKAKVANSFLSESRFLDFYNPDDADWAVKFREVLKGEYKEGYFGKEQGYNFSDKNASLISNALLQAQGSQDPQGILDLIDKANRAYLTVEGKGKISAEDANLLRGFTHMGMLNIGQDEKGDQVFEVSPTWQSLMTSTDNIFQNEAKIARERAGIQKGDYEIKEELNFLKYETLPDIQQSLNELDMQKLLEQQMKTTFESMDTGVVDDKTQLEKERELVQSNMDDISTRIEQKEDRVSTSQVKLSQMQSFKAQGFVIDEAELQQLSKDISEIKDSINIERDNLKTANDERIIAANKLMLERQNIPITEENLMLLSQKLKKQQAATDLSKSMNRLMMTGGM